MNLFLKIFSERISITKTNMAYPDREEESAELEAGAEPRHEPSQTVERPQHEGHGDHLKQGQRT